MSDPLYRIDLSAEHEHWQSAVNVTIKRLIEHGVLQRVEPYDIAYHTIPGPIRIPDMPVGTYLIVRINDE